MVYGITYHLTLVRNVTLYTKPHAKQPIILDVIYEKVPQIGDAI